VHRQRGRGRVLCKSAQGTGVLCTEASNAMLASPGPGSRSVRRGLRAWGLDYGRAGVCGVGASCLRKVI
jgi:hypothetical protein